MSSQDFAQNFVNAFAAGQTARTRKRKEAEEEEDRKIEKDILAHRIKELKIQDKIRAREGAKENLDMLQGRPESEFRNATDEDMHTGGEATTGIGGAPANMVPIRKPTINIPGIEEIGLPGVSRQPDTLEQILGQQTAALRMKARNTAQSASRGEVIALPGQNPGDEPEVLATGQEFPEPLRPYTTRDLKGVEKTEHITAEEEARRGPAVKQPIPRRPSGGNAALASGQQIRDNAEGIINGDFDPLDVTGVSNNAIKIRSALKGQGFDLNTAQDEARTTRRKITAATAPSMLKLAASMDATAEALAAVKTANDAAKKAGGWSKYVGQDRANLNSAIAQFKSNIATMIELAGGSDAVNKDLIAVSGFLSTGVFAGPLDKEIERAEKALQYRVGAIKKAISVKDATGGGTKQAAPQEYDYDPKTGTLVPKKP